MRRRCPRGNCAYIGWIIAGIGLMILLALVAPSVFWWFILGVALVIFGLVIACR